MAQGDLEAFVGWPIKGCLNEDSAIGQKLGEDVFFPLVCHSSFLQASYWLCTAEDPFGYAAKWKLKPQQDPD